jgi:hypothetical protein
MLTGSNTFSVENILKWSILHLGCLFAAMDISYGTILCFACQDYVYDVEYEEMASLNMEVSHKSLGLPHQYRPWEPSPDEQELLLEHPRRKRMASDSTIGKASMSIPFYMV